MTAAELLDDLTGRGFRLEACDDGIGVVPASRLIDTQIEAIREHKTELLVLLRSGAPPAVQKTASKRKQRKTRKRVAVPKNLVQPIGQGEEPSAASDAAIPPVETEALPSPIDPSAPSEAVQPRECRRCGERWIHLKDKTCWHCGGLVDVPEMSVISNPLFP